MRRKTGFTLIELLVVISIIALLIGILLPALAAAKKAANMLKNNTQLRQVNQGMMNFAAANKDWFPGRDYNGAVVTTIGTSTVDGNLIETRFTLLLQGNYFNGEICLSPAETNATTAWTTGLILPSGTQTRTQTLSYAMLCIDSSIDGGATSASGRQSEARNTQNAAATLISDRGIRHKDTTHFRSLWTSPAEGTDDWKGGVVYGDGHVNNESNDQVANTKFGSVNMNKDHLFTYNVYDDTHDVSANTTNDDGSNAFMVYDGATDTAAK